MLLNGTGDVIDDYDYPATTDELIAECGDHTLELPNGTEQVGDVLSRLESETFVNSEEARFAIYCGVSDKAIGRVGYSDRDPTPVGSPYTPDAVSF